jgi:hypothetical protein
MDPGPLGRLRFTSSDPLPATVAMISLKLDQERIDVRLGGALHRRKSGSGVSSWRAGMANANALNAGADGVLRQGAAQESDVRYQSRKAIGAQAAAQWSNGFMGGTGSALDSVYESQVSAALDALRIRQGAQDQANSMNFQARLAREGAWFGLAGA